MTAKSIAIYIFGEISGIAGMSVALFWSAGRTDWWPAWAAITVWVAWYATMDVIIFRFNPGLLAERLALPRGQNLGQGHREHHSPNGAGALYHRRA